MGGRRAPELTTMPNREQIGGDRAGTDHIGGTLGSDVAGAAVGKDIQNVSINLGDKTPGEIAQILAGLTRQSDRLQIAVYGDASVGAPGVVARLTKIDDLAAQMGALSKEMAELTRALLGDDRYKSVGLVQQVQQLTIINERRERWRQLSTWALAILAASQIAGWIAMWRIYVLYAAIAHGLGQ